jgi:hypothetical protein
MLYRWRIALGRQHISRFGYSRSQAGQVLCPSEGPIPSIALFWSVLQSVMDISPGNQTPRLLRALDCCVECQGHKVSITTMSQLARDSPKITHASRVRKAEASPEADTCGIKICICKGRCARSMSCSCSATISQVNSASHPAACPPSRLASKTPSSHCQKCVLRWISSRFAHPSCLAHPPKPKPVALQHSCR